MNKSHLVSFEGGPVDGTGEEYWDTEIPLPTYRTLLFRRDDRLWSARYRYASTNREILNRPISKYVYDNSEAQVPDARA